MDILDINKVANRKRINVEADKLREKVSRETAKIIKLKVAQDTAYWDLKEKLHQLENNHERLQQNMLEVQMQHETLSGQYQDELRLRPETINKLTSTREICDVLEDYSERLKDTLSRCKADQATLCEAYQKSGQFVKDLKIKQTVAEDKAKMTVAALEERIKQSSDHQSQLMTLFNASKQQSDDELREIKAKLNTAQAQKDELLKIANDMARDMDARKYELEARDKSVSSLQSELKRLVHEFNTQAADMKNTMAKQEKELKDYSETIETLKKALTNQEDFTKTVCEQNSALQERISALEQDEIDKKMEMEQLLHKLQDMTLTSDLLRQDVASLNNAKIDLEKLVDEKNLVIHNATAEIASIQSQLDELNKEKSALQEQLAQLNEDNVVKTNAIEELGNTVRDGEARICGLEKELQDLKITHENTIKDLNTELDKKQKENISKGETVNQLINDINKCLEVRSRLELSIEKGKKEMEAEREKAWEKERSLAKQVEHLEKVSRDKEEELNKQMNIILEMRTEKEKLQSKMSGMQATIDNIQRELSGRLAAPLSHCAHPPELDDNNANMSPVKKPGPPLQPPNGAAPRRRPPPPPPPPSQLDSMLFSLLSDSSMDGDAVDPSEVNRRFEALSRGEHVAPISLASLKRRRAATPIRHNLPTNQAPLSLSQVREDVTHKEKTFFKSKRHGENKMKRTKKIEETDK